MKFPELQNATIERVESWESADSRFPNEFLDVAQGLVLPVIEWLDTKTLACRIEIKDVDGNNVIPSIPDERLTQNVTFFFKANF